MNRWVILIKDVGFPIAVAAYVLIRLDQRLAELVQAFNHLANQVEFALRNLGP